ncbi:hypothetical protein AB7849_15590 [Rhodanobacter sp. 115]|uniref:hypothetical protein n=1 Tax=Rhodanobacter sp. FW021-MT20 TaxID=1162282 RepID=UPI0034E585BB
MDRNRWPAWSGIRNNPVFRVLAYLGDAVSVVLGTVSASAPEQQTDLFATAA